VLANSRLLYSTNRSNKEIINTNDNISSEEKSVSQLATFSVSQLDFVVIFKITKKKKFNRKLAKCNVAS